MSEKKDTLNFIEKQMSIIEIKTGINPKLILGVLGVALGLTLVGMLDKYITCVVAITLPAYWSIKAIESDDKTDDKQWLTYWCVYACFTFVDLFAGFIMKFLPFYFFIKQLFLIWCFMPNTQGATYIYNWIIIPFFKKYQNKIESGVNKVFKKGKEYAEKTKEVIKENAESTLNKINETMKTN